MVSNSDRSASSSPPWTPKQSSLFETALVLYEEDIPDRWEKVARVVVGKSVEEVKRCYEKLAEEVMLIESLPAFPKNRRPIVKKQPPPTEQHMHIHFRSKY